MLEPPAEACAEFGGMNLLAQEGSKSRRNHASIERIHARVPNRPGITSVTGKRFVAAFAGQYDGDMLASKLGKMVQCDTGSPADGLIFVPDHIGQGLKELPARDLDFMMLCANMIRDNPGVRQLAVGL